MSSSIQMQVFTFPLISDGPDSLQPEAFEAGSARALPNPLSIPFLR